MMNEGFWRNTLALFESILPILERPEIQRQILAALLIFAMAWLVQRLGSRIPHWSLLRSRRQTEQSTPAWSTSLLRVARALSQMYFPIIGILLGLLIIQLFVQREWLVGLLEQLQLFFALLLIYRIIVATLYLFLSEAKARSYHARFLKPLFFLALLAGLNQILSGVVSFAEQRLLTISERDITVGSLFVAGVVLYLFMVISWLARDIITYLILPRVNLDLGTSNTILTISQYIVVAAGILSALAVLGIDLSTLAIIGAGLSVGIGFGLQELVANFISGILLLFEQVIRPGDVIEIDGKLGTVQRLRIRATTIRTRDNIEIIVPNQNLLTASVTTYTHSERLVRVNIPVGVSYDSSPTEVREALLATGRRHGLVKKRPEPNVFFDGFGDSSLDFALTVWIENAELIRPIRSDLHFMIWEELTKRKIEVPFPQRDLHIRSGLPKESLTNQELAPNEAN